MDLRANIVTHLFSGREIVQTVALVQKLRMSELFTAKIFVKVRCYSFPCHSASLSRSRTGVDSYRRRRILFTAADLIKLA